MTAQPTTQPTALVAEDDCLHAQNLDVTAFRRGALDMVAIAAERLRAAGPVQVARRPSPPIPTGST